MATKKLLEKFEEENKLAGEPIIFKFPEGYCGSGKCEPSDSTQEIILNLDAYRRISARTSEEDYNSSYKNTEAEKAVDRLAEKRARGVVFTPEYNTQLNFENSFLGQ